MRAYLFAAWLLFTLQPSTSAAQGAARIELRGLAAEVTIIPENRTDIAMSVLQRNPKLPVRISIKSRSVVIDGGMAHRIKGCPSVDGERQIRISGLGHLLERDLPRFVFRTPMNIEVRAGDGVSGFVGRSLDLGLENHGCGEWSIANVGGHLRLSQIGGGALRAGRSQPADLNVAGGGKIEAQSVVGTLTAVSTDDGSIVVDEVSGPVIARVAGSGIIEVKAGGAPEFNAQVAGSGDVHFGGAAGAVSAEVDGTGDVRIAKASGPVARRTLGSGRIEVGH